MIFHFQLGTEELRTRHPHEYLVSPSDPHDSIDVANQVKKSYFNV
jgi:hypothetical protein